MTLLRRTIIDHLIPRTGRILESPRALRVVTLNRAGGRAFGLAQQVVQQRVTRWERVETRTEHRRKHNGRATAGSDSVMRAKVLQERDNQVVQARQHRVLQDTKAQVSDQRGGAEFRHKTGDKRMISHGIRNESETFVEQTDNSNLSSTDSSATYASSSGSTAGTTSLGSLETALVSRQLVCPCLRSSKCYVCSLTHAWRSSRYRGSNHDRSSHRSSNHARST